MAILLLPWSCHRLLTLCSACSQFLTVCTAAFSFYEKCWSFLSSFTFFFLTLFHLVEKKPRKLGKFWFLEKLHSNFAIVWRLFKRRKKKFKMQTWSGVQQKTPSTRVQLALCIAPLPQRSTIPLLSQKEVFWNCRRCS